MLRRFSGRKHWFNACIVLAKEFNPFTKCFCAEGLPQFGFQPLLGSMIRQLPFAVIGPSQHSEQLFPEGGFETSDRDVAAIAGFIVVIERSAIEHLIFRSGFFTATQPLGPIQGMQAENSISHAQVDVLTLTGLVAMNHCGQEGPLPCDAILRRCRRVGNRVELEQNFFCGLYHSIPKERGS